MIGNCVIKQFIIALNYWPEVSKVAIVRGILLVIHVVSAIYWLGPDIMAFYLSFGARDRNASPDMRQERLRILRVADGIVRYAWRISYVTGALLIATGDWRAYLNDPWMIAKIALAGAIFIVIRILRRVSVLGKLRDAIAAQAAGDPQADQLEDAVAKGTPRSLSLVLLIWALFLAILVISILR